MMPMTRRLITIVMAIQPIESIGIPFNIKKIDVVRRECAESTNYHRTKICQSKPENSIGDGIDPGI